MMRGMHEQWFSCGPGEEGSVVIETPEGGQGELLSYLAKQNALVALSFDPGHVRRRRIELAA